MASGPTFSHSTEQAVTATVGSDQRATGDVGTTTSETHIGASVRALGKTPIASGIGLLTGGTKLLQSQTEVSGMRLSDEDFAAIAATARDRPRWEHAFRGLPNKSMSAWQALGRQIVTSGGDREVISRALAQYASANPQASDAVQAVVRPRVPLRKRRQG